MLLSNRWSTGIGDIGILVDLATSQLTSRSNFFRTEPYFRKRLPGETEDVFIPGGYDFGDEEFKRTRSGIYAAAQWAPSDDLTLTGIYFQSRYKNHNQSHFAMQTSQDLTVNRNQSEFDDNGALLSTSSMFLRDASTFLPTGNPINGGGGTEGTRSNSMTRDISAEFSWQPGQGPLKISGAYQNTLSTSRLDRLAIFRDVPFPSTFGFDLTGDFPKITLPASIATTLANPANYSWSAAMPHNERNRGTMDSFNLDAEYTFEDSFFRAVKVGGRVSERRERDLNNGFTWSALGRGWNGDPQLTFADARPGDVEYYAFDNFFHGDIDVPANTLWPSIALLEGVTADELHRPAPLGYGGPRSRLASFLPQDLGLWKTETSAAYAQVRFGRDYEAGTLGFSGNIGGRVVHVKNESHGFIVQDAFTYIRN